MPKFIDFPKEFDSVLSDKIENWLNNKNEHNIIKMLKLDEDSLVAIYDLDETTVVQYIEGEDYVD